MIVIHQCDRCTSTQVNGCVNCPKKEACTWQPKEQGGGMI